MDGMDKHFHMIQSSVLTDTNCVPRKLYESDENKRLTSGAFRAFEITSSFRRVFKTWTQASQLK